MFDARIAVVAAGAASLDVSTTAQVITIAIGLAGALAVGSGKRKDGIIRDLEKAVETEERLHLQTNSQLEGAQARADEEHRQRRAEEKRAAKLDGQIEELRQYAAPEAFQEIVKALGRLEGVLGTAVTEQGNLVVQNSALLEGQFQILKKVADDLGLLAERLGAGGDRPAQM